MINNTTVNLKKKNPSNFPFNYFHFQTIKDWHIFTVYHIKILLKFVITGENAEVQIIKVLNLLEQV